MMDTEVNVKSGFYTDEFEIDHENNLESKVTYNKLLLPGLCLVE